MKPDEITCGIFEVGRFKISIQRIPFESLKENEANYFEILIHEYGVCVGKHIPVYVHLIDDPRFAWFFHFGKFSKPIRAEECLEYNTFILRKSKECPVWRLSRHSIATLFEICSKAKKPKSPPREIMAQFPKQEINLWEKEKRIVYLQKIILGKDCTVEPWKTLRRELKSYSPSTNG